MATETVTWASIGSAGSWVASTGTLLACVQTESDGTHGIEPTSDTSMFGVPADFTAGTSETVNSVTIRVVMRVATAGDSCQVSNMLRVGAGSNVSHPTSHLVDQTTFTEYEWVWATQPNGTAWTVADANNIARCYLDPSFSALAGALHLDVVQVVLDYGAASTDATVAPPALALTVSLPAPTVTATASATVDSPALGLALGLPAPTVTAENVVTGEPLALALGFPAPTVTGGSGAVDATVTPPALALTLGLPAPTVTATSSATVAAPALDLLATFPAPTVTAQRNVTVTPPALGLVLGLPVPLVYGATGTPVAPAARTLTVAAESRVLAVRAESRVLTIAAESRTLEVPT